MEQHVANTIKTAGWVLGNFDGYVGTRIYPASQGAYEGKRLVMQDVRVMLGHYLIHDPYNNRVIATLGTDFKAVEAYLLENGKVREEGVNVWD